MDVAVTLAKSVAAKAFAPMVDKDINAKIAEAAEYVHTSVFDRNAKIVVVAPSANTNEYVPCAKIAAAVPSATTNAYVPNAKIVAKVTVPLPPLLLLRLH